MFIAALSTITKTWKQPKCSLTDEWKDKIQYMRYYSARKTKQNKTKIMPFAGTYMQLEVIILVK